MQTDNKRGLLALSPLMVFIGLYLVTSILAGDFYKVPLSVAFSLSGIYAIAVSREKPVAKRVSTFSRGAGADNIMLMIWIFILAGMFANTASDIGSVEATVNCMLKILPSNMLLAGMFIATCFISLSIGTSVGTIVALAPIAAGLAHSTDASIPLMTAIVVGGAFFGDNLSFISDTTIAATSSQGCNMSDKFKVNAYIAFPVAVAVLIAYAVMGQGARSPENVPAVDYLKIVPYIAVLVTALAGMNVMVVLAIGVALTGVIGMAEGVFDFFGWMESMGKGVQSMSDLIIITMLAGGLFETVRTNGGIDYIIAKTTSRIHGKRGAEMVMALLVSLVDICTANNTVAIITVGGIAKQISQTYGVDSRKAASILDTMSCCVQGIIPYGAQILMAASLTGLAPTDILPYLYYPYALGIFALLCIIFRIPRSCYNQKTQPQA